MPLQKPVVIAFGTVIVGLGLAGDGFAMQPLAQGYLLAAGDTAKTAEGRCGEGRCGVAIPDTDKDGRVSPGEFAAAWPDEAARFAQADADGDGYISAEEMKAYHAAASGDDGKASMEGKCGEGKCGGMA